jgi:hypothetical protein
VHANWATFLILPSILTSKPNTMAKPPKELFEEKAVNPKKEDAPKWYYFLTKRKTPQIYERELEKNDFPKELSGLVSR